MTAAVIRVALLRDALKRSMNTDATVSARDTADVSAANSTSRKNRIATK